MKYAFGIGSDTSQGAPGDALEYSASAGSAAYLMGADNLVAQLLDTHCYMTDTPDFWRREGAHYPEHGGRFTGEPAYWKHVSGAVLAMLKKANMKPEDFNYIVFHQPNGKFPAQTALKLGFKEPQFKHGLLTPAAWQYIFRLLHLGISATWILLNRRTYSSGFLWIRCRKRRLYMQYHRQACLSSRYRPESQETIRRT